MKKMVMLALMLLMVVIQILPAATGAFNPNWLPAQSKWVIHFDHTVFSQTRLFSIVDKNWRDDKKSFHSEILDEMDIDISKDLMGLTVIGMNRIDRGDNVLVILQGRFNQDQLVKRIKAKEKKVLGSVVAGLNVLSWDSDSHLFFPSKDVLVFCETKSGIDEMVKLMKGKARAISGSSPLLKMLAEAPRNAFVRAAVADVSDLTKYAPKTMVLDSASVAFFMALEAKDNLFMTLKLLTESEEKAQNLQQVISGLRALVSLKAFDKDNDTSQFMDLLNAVAVTTEGRRLVMNFDYSVDSIGRLVDGMKDKNEYKKRKKDKR